MNLLFRFLPVLLLTGCDETKDPECLEKPRDTSGCYAVYQPVCGCNGKTYSNDCEARAHNITTFTSGACKKKD